MRLLILSKRHPQQRDLIERPYGRFHHLPAALAVLGHTVRVQLCSYRRLHSTEIERENVLWSSNDILSLGPRGFSRALSVEARAFRPDWIIGCSDTWVGWLAYRLSRTCKAHLAIDAYDNFEAYMPWNLPLHWAWKRAIKAADLVTAAGPHLAEHLQQHRQVGARLVEVLPMTADPVFVAMDRSTCRTSLGLPDTAPLIGYSGGWARNRGTHVLLESFRRVRAVRPDARLVLSGHPPRDACAEPGVITMGYLDDAQLPVLLNALNVACVITADTAFGRYSYPAKLCEAMACGVPIVATATEPVSWMLGNNSRFLATVGNAEDIAARIIANFDSGRIEYGELPSWQKISKRFETMLAA